MKGLKEYIDVHGNHFTVALALVATGNRWGADTVKRVSDNKVYYNVTGSTLGDMVYLVNSTYFSTGETVHRCVDKALDVVGDFDYYGGKVFLDWLDSMVSSREDIDFSKYV